jgi:phospho-N-acetylmuramoyl-pentapeptide-transferase
MAIEHYSLPVGGPALLLSVAVVAGLGCAAILAFLLKTGLAWRLATDIPNERSLHERPTPRVGGWGLVPMVIVAVLALAPHLWLIALCTIFLGAVSQIDDRRGLPARVRFSAHLLAAAVLLIVYPAPLPWWILAALAVVLVWLVNLYNFMDGADGLAGGMAVFGFGGYAMAATMAQGFSSELALVCTAAVGAAAGFLAFNFHPARVFLGDAGSIPLGFLAGALGYWGWSLHVWPVWFPAMCFSPFIADASVTLLRRLMRGEKFWQAHREHYYQRMVRSGLGHATTALCWYALMFAGIMLASWGRERTTVVQSLLVIAWAGTLVLAGAAIDLRWRRFQAAERAKGDVNV